MRAKGKSFSAMKINITEIRTVNMSGDMKLTRITFSQTEPVKGFEFTPKEAKNQLILKN